MKRCKARILPAAYNDMKLARKWYKQHNPALPKRFVYEARLVIDRIKEMPFSHSIRYKEVRIAILPRFPYAVHYILENDTVIIIAIHHIAINPKQWESRL